MNEMYNVSVSPHLRSKTGTNSIMRDVAIALLPACLFDIYNFLIHDELMLHLVTIEAFLNQLIHES